MDNLNTKIDKLLNMIAEMLVKVSGKKKEIAFYLWPLHPTHGTLFFTQSWFSRLYGIFKRLEKKGVGDEKIAVLLQAPSRIAQMFWKIEVIKQSGLSEKERVYIIEKLFNVLAFYRKKDIFCKDGKNIIWDPKKIREITEKVKFVDICHQRELKQSLYVLESALLLYAELIYFMHHPFTHSFQGLYGIDNKKLLRRYYFDLKPEKIWKFTKNLTFKEVEIFEIYTGDIKMEFDFFERGTRTTTAYRDRLLKMAINIDGRKIFTKNEIQKVMSNLNEVIIEGSKYIQGLSQQDLLAKYAEQWFYVLKPLSDLLNEDWKPPQEVYDNIYKKSSQFNKIWKNIGEQQKKSAILPVKKRIEDIKKRFDPRD